MFDLGCFCIIIFFKNIFVCFLFYYGYGCGKVSFFYFSYFLKLICIVILEKIFYEKGLVLKYRVVVIKILLIIFYKYLNYVYCGYWF